MSNLMLGNDFLMALRDAGILQPDDKTKRVVIDASVDAAVKIYIENYGDERLLEITTHPSLQIATKIRTTEMDPDSD